MSESYVSTPSNESADDQSGKVETAKQEASHLKDTAASQAKNVAGTAKEEAKNVAGEAKSQVKNLYAQGKRQLADQAGTQQQRVASGLRSVGDELDSMASSSENSGVASDIVRNVSQRIGSAASFLEDRDPASLLEEVKSFARRRPAVFIGGAALVGLVVGRLTRALAQNAADEKSADSTPDYRAVNTEPRYAGDYGSTGGYAGGVRADAADTAPSGVYGTGVAGAAGVGVAGAAGYGAGEGDLGTGDVGSSDYGTGGAVGEGGYGGPDSGATEDVEGLTTEDTPLYAQSTATWEGDLPGEANGDVRSDSV